MFLLLFFFFFSQVNRRPEEDSWVRLVAEGEVPGVMAQLEKAYIEQRTAIG